MGEQRAIREGQPFNPIARLQSKDGICIYLGGISHATYDSWQAKGLVPGPVPGTTRYDVRQHDLLIDQRLGLQKAPEAKSSALDNWRAGRAG